MNYHAEGSVSDVTSGAGDADDMGGAPDGFVDEVCEGDQEASVLDRSVDEAENRDAAVGPTDGSVEDAVTRLDKLESIDVSEHPEIYDEIQRSLASALDDTPANQADQ